MRSKPNGRRPASRKRATGERRLGLLAAVVLVPLAWFTLREMESQGFISKAAYGASVRRLLGLVRRAGAA